ncbi:MAG: hypothetical protein HUU41_08805 [Bryobacteraceae bacterium]|nr:hypothetical protein [Bryobacterales bacterium]MEB2360439.1 hypothetical protein [Bryobacterales bacterium]NUN01199.1 hypothetical protein [Bryobacteraceae bacterium]
MKSPSPSPEEVHYSSEVTIPSQAIPGVTFTIRRMSFGRRIELTRMVRELTVRMEFLEAGQDLRDKIEAAFVANEVDAVYLRWGLLRVEGLEIDGNTATPELAIAAGPEALVREILIAVKHECALTEDEAKN